MFTYTATVYFNSHVINTKSSDDLDSLFIWLLTEGDQDGDSSGQIIHNLSQEIVKKFKKNSCLN